MMIKHPWITIRTIHRNRNKILKEKRLLQASFFLIGLIVVKKGVFWVKTSI